MENIYCQNGHITISHAVDQVRGTKYSLMPSYAEVKMTTVQGNVATTLKFDAYIALALIEKLTELFEFELVELKDAKAALDND